MIRREAGDGDCAAVREVAAEFVLGTLDGHERATVVEHIDGCARCRNEISSLAGAMSDLALLAPPLAPSPGFADRVLAELERTGQPGVTSGDVAGAGDAAPVAPASTVAATRSRTSDQRRRRRPVIAVASLAAAAVVLIVVASTVAHRSSPSTGVLAVAAMVDADRQVIGTSSLAAGVPGTVRVSVSYPSHWLDYRLEAVDASGQVRTLGSLHLVDGTWQWSGPLPDGELRELRIVRPDGRVTCAGMLPV